MGTMLCALLASRKNIVFLQRLELNCHMRLDTANQRHAQPMSFGPTECICSAYQQDSRMKPKVFAVES